MMNMDASLRQWVMPGIIALRGFEFFNARTARGGILQCMIDLISLIERDRGAIEAALYRSFSLAGPEELASTGFEILKMLPPLFGKCAQMSAMWAAILRDRHGIPAVVVAGDLVIDGQTIFLCSENVVHPNDERRQLDWTGHCWIEVDGWLGDISIFRTARAIEQKSVLKDFIQMRFGAKAGLMMVEPAKLDAMGMGYIAKHVLTDGQISGLVTGMRLELDHLRQLAGMGAPREP
jgi:hypothetical protein